MWTHVLREPRPWAWPMPSKHLQSWGLPVGKKKRVVHLHSTSSGAYLLSLSPSTSSLPLAALLAAVSLGGGAIGGGPPAGRAGPASTAPTAAVAGALGTIIARGAGTGLLLVPASGLSPSMARMRLVSSTLAEISPFFSLVSIRGMAPSDGGGRRAVSAARAAAAVVCACACAAGGCARASSRWRLPSVDAPPP